MDWPSGPTLLIGAVSVAVVGGLITLGVRYLEARSRREEDAARLQVALTAPLAHEPALAGSSVLPVVSIPRRGPARVELTGWVGSGDGRDAAVRAVEREGVRLGQPLRVVVHLQVLDAIRRPA
jgi:hypothetical protein